MPARIKTTAQLELSGAFKKNPQRKKARMLKAKSKGIGSAPRHLSSEEKAVWYEIVKSCPPGVLTVSDKILVEITTGLLSLSRQADPMRSSDRSLLIKCLGQLGLNPADRQRLDIPKVEKKPNPFSKVGYR